MLADTILVIGPGITRDHPGTAPIAVHGQLGALGIDRGRALWSETISLMERTTARRRRRHDADDGAMRTAERCGRQSDAGGGTTWAAVRR